MKDLVQIIKDNPGAIAIVDNDGWSLHTAEWNEPPDFNDEPNAYENWEEQNTLADSSDELSPLKGSTYGGPDAYGGALLLALAEIANINVESF